MSCICLQQIAEYESKLVELLSARGDVRLVGVRTGSVCIDVIFKDQEHLVDWSSTTDCEFKPAVEEHFTRILPQCGKFVVSIQVEALCQMATGKLAERIINEKYI